MINYQKNDVVHAAPILHPMSESARVCAVQSAAAHVLTFILGSVDVVKSRILSFFAGMNKSKLSDSEWVHLIGSLKKMPGIQMGCEVTCRRFVEAVLWMLRSGAQWRLLPNRLGLWSSVFKRFSSWSRFCVWEQMLASVSVKADMQNVCIDSTEIRAHACAAGAAASNATAQALGRSRGGFGCKIHALTDALGLPIRFILTGGQTADITQATPLMQGISTSALLADKGYDANALLDWLVERDIAAVIPPKANPKVQRSCDGHMYKERHVIECMFGKLKYFRRVATRYEKKASHFMEMLTFAAVLLWLR